MFAMLNLIEQHRPQLLDLCRKYGVRRLDLFGSGASGAFDPARSDLDFLVLFGPMNSMSKADQYLGLVEDLAALFNRKVDLVDVSAASNPYFMAEALKKRVMLYAA
jgi:predicted nucleotidyltransferase